MQPKNNNYFKTTIISIISVLVLIILVFLSLWLLFNFENKTGEQTFLVVNVIDGDTFEIATGEKVRLICVNAPESGEEGYVKSKNFLEKLILGKEVILEMDTTDKDSYDRLLRYVYLDNNETKIFINREIVKEGHAIVFPYGNDTEKCEEIKR